MMFIDLRSDKHEANRSLSFDVAKVTFVRQWELDNGQVELVVNMIGGNRLTLVGWDMKAWHSLLFQISAQTRKA